MARKPRSRSRSRRRRLRWALAAGSVLITCAALELAAGWAWRREPASEWERRALSGYYSAWERRIVQFTPGSARYDDELTYRLRPGVHRFANREFDTTISVNSAGLRDDEASLAGPEIVVLGDSYAMGWGVEDGETYAAVLERETGLRTLNAAMSSYGTVRELLTLGRLDRSRLRVLVIQFCGNDHGENLAYLENGRLEVMSERRYRAVVAKHRAKRLYFPMKRALTLPRFFWAQRPRPESVVGPSMAEEAEAFLGVLDRFLSRAPDEAYPVVVHRLGFYADLAVTDDFGRELSSLLSEERFSPLAERVQWVSAHEGLGPKDFYPLDQHLVPAGQATVAASLARAITATLESPPPVAAQ